MKVFVINLERDKDRWASISKQLDREGIDFERFPGVDGRCLTEEELQMVYRKDRALFIQGFELSRAHIGCSLSHVYAYKAVVDRGIEMALILEDDVIIPDGFGDQLLQLEALVDTSRPEVVLLSPAEGSGRTLRSTEGATSFTLQSYASGFFASAFIVTNISARALWKEYFPIIDVADNWPRLHRHRVVDILITAPALVQQDQETFGSSTNADHQTVWQGNWRFAIQYKARRLRFFLCDPMLAWVHRFFRPYNGVLKKPRN